MDPGALVDEAVAATGLDDLGPDGWQEGLEVLCRALDEEARLNGVGVLAFTERLGAALRSRLAVVEWRATHPEVAEEVIEGPVIITGLPRTGTTALSNLLAQDPATRSLQVWESASPVPPPEAATYATDPRIAQVQAGLDLFHQMVPEMKLMHDDTATSTAEHIDLLAMTFSTNHFGGMARIPSYDTWWLATDVAPAYRFHHDVLQVLQSRCPPTRWHLKNPPDLFCLDAVIEAYPDVRFIWTHRDPAAVLPSVTDLIRLVTGMATDDLDRLELGAYQVELWGTAVDRGLAARDRMGEDRFVDVQVRDLVADPVATVAGIYEAVGWPFTAEAEAGVSGWWADNPPGKHGAHEPDPAAYGLDPDVLRHRFADYLERFDG
jgi:Sulfotransferase family